MKTMNLKPLLRYRLRDSLSGALVFIGVIILLTALMVITSLRATSGDGSTGSFNAFGFAAWVVMLVFGICTIREDLRLGMQLGCGRRTIFTSDLLSALLVSLALAVAGQIIILAGQALTAGSSELLISDLYQLLYTDSPSEKLTLAENLLATLFNFSLMVSAYMTGMLISLVFYRLNRFWTIVVAIGVPLLLMVGLPLAGRVLPPVISRFFLTQVWPLMEACFHSAGLMILCSLLSSALLGLFNWLLLRRAPVKAGAKG